MAIKTVNAILICINRTVVFQSWDVRYYQLIRTWTIILQYRFTKAATNRRKATGIGKTVEINFYKKRMSMGETFNLQKRLRQDMVEFFKHMKDCHTDEN